MSQTYFEYMRIKSKGKEKENGDYGSGGDGNK